VVDAGSCGENCGDKVFSYSVNMDWTYFSVSMAVSEEAELIN
jgi:hypothetical protein